MNNDTVVISYICGGLFGAVAYIGFLVMFIYAVWKGDYIFHYGRVRGKTARAIGVIGLVGMAAGTYLLIGYAFFHTNPPFSSIAWLFFGLLLVVLFFVRFLSLFMWHDK